MPTLFDGESHPERIHEAIDARLLAIDPVVSAIRLRNRCRQDRGTWIVSLAVPVGHVYDLGTLEAVVAEFGIIIEGVFEYDGDLGEALRNDLGEPPTRDGLPLTNEDQLCAFCDQLPGWVHPLAEDGTAFNLNGRPHTLPTFWTVCSRCEDAYQAGLDDELVRRQVDIQGNELALAEKVTEVFRAADLGRRPLTHVP